MKNLAVLFFALVFSAPLFAQVKFNLKYEPETRVYTFSILPETTWPAPKNTVGSAQIVLRVDANVEFTPSITSLTPGVVLADNAYVERPAAAPGYTFVCISLASGPTNKIALAEGVEVPVFSFTNAGGGCAGVVELLDNSDPVVNDIMAEGYNVTQSFGVLGARGNAFSGLVNSVTDCVATSTGVNSPSPKFIEGVQVMPVPASDEVTVRWNLMTETNEHLDMIVRDNLGREVYRQTVVNAKGEHVQKIIVKNWKSGTYRISFQYSNGHMSQVWNLVVLH